MLLDYGQNYSATNLKAQASLSAQAESTATPFRGLGFSAVTRGFALGATQV